MWFNKSMRSLYTIIIIGLFIVTLLRLFCPYSICTIESNSMEPTLHDGDVVLCSTMPTFPNKGKPLDNKDAYNAPTLSQNNIIIFKSTNNSGQNWIKRIAKVIHHGTPLNLNAMNANEVRSIVMGDGNHLVIRNNAFYINGKKSNTYRPQQNFYYVNGDNQQTSYDSRKFGYIPQSSVLAMAQFGFFSIHNRKIRIFFTLKRNLMQGVSNTAFSHKIKWGL